MLPKMIQWQPLLKANGCIFLSIASLHLEQGETQERKLPNFRSNIIQWTCLKLVIEIPTSCPRLIKGLYHVHGRFNASYPQRFILDSTRTLWMVKRAICRHHNHRRRFHPHYTAVPNHCQIIIMFSSRLWFQADLDFSSQKPALNASHVPVVGRSI